MTLNDKSLRAYTDSCADYYVKPGFLFVSEEPTVLRTVLGSCVSVCLYDRKRKYGGINHFLMPDDLKGESTPRFARPSIHALIQAFLDFGSALNDLHAQIVGGAGMPQHVESLAIGAANARVAREVLGQRGIQIRSEDVGGNMGRKVLYLSELDQLMVVKLERIRSADYFDYRDRGRKEYGREN